MSQEYKKVIEKITSVATLQNYHSLMILTTILCELRSFREWSTASMCSVLWANRCHVFDLHKDVFGGRRAESFDLCTFKKQRAFPDREQGCLPTFTGTYNYKFAIFKARKITFARYYRNSLPLGKVSFSKMLCMQKYQNFKKSEMLITFIINVI